MDIYKKCILLLLCGIILPGCVASKRGMIAEHTYRSERFPNLQIEVDSTFQYIKGGPSEWDHAFKGPYDRRMLFFEHKSITKSQNLDYFNHPSHWIYFGIPEEIIINKGETTLLDNIWYYANTLEKIDNGCSLAKNLRRFTADQNLFLIKYMMWLSDEDCSKWEYSFTLTAEKEGVLKNLDLSFQEVANIRTYNSENQHQESDNTHASQHQNNSQNQDLSNIAARAYNNKEYKTAFSIWSDLALQGSVESMYRVAELYEWGYGVEKDMVRALSFYRKAAMAGHGDAQYSYANKLGTTRKAYFWYNAVINNQTASTNSRERAYSESNAFETVANFSLTANEKNLLKTLSKYSKGKSPNVDESLFVGY